MDFRQLDGFQWYKVRHSLTGDFDFMRRYSFDSAFNRALFVALAVPNFNLPSKVSFKISERLQGPVGTGRADLEAVTPGKQVGYVEMRGNFPADGGAAIERDAAVGIDNDADRLIISTALDLRLDEIDAVGSENRQDYLFELVQQVFQGQLRSTRPRSAGSFTDNEDKPDPVR